MKLNKQLPPELVEECKKNLAEKHNIHPSSMLEDYYINCAQIAVDYAERENSELRECIKSLISEGYKQKTHHKDLKWREALENAETLIKSR